MAYIRRKFSEAYALSHAEKGNNRFGTYNFSDDEIFSYKTISYRPGLITKYADYAVIYHADRDVIGIYFQGSADVGDWSANFTAISTKSWRTVTFNGKKTKLEVHKGWYNMYNAMKGAIKKEYQQLKAAHPNAELEIIGHSLGAGMAQICAEDMFNDFGVKSHCFTYGSVKPFKMDETGKQYLNSCCKEVYNFCDTSDIVCYLPPFDGYDHINAVWIDYSASGLDYKIDNVFSYHFVYDIEKLYENANAYADGVPTLETNKVSY